MLSPLVSWSLKHRFAVIALAGVVLALGVHASMKARQASSRRASRR